VSKKSENETTIELDNTGDYKLQKSGKLNKEESQPQIEFFKVGRAFKDGGIRCRVIEGEECAILEKLHISNNEEPRQKVKRPPPPSAPKPTSQEKAQVKAEAKLQAHLEKQGKKEEKLKAKVQAAQEPGFLKKLKTYLTEEPKPKPVIIDTKRIPPFDIQDIPDAMDTQKLPIAAKFMRKWFAGDANYAVNREMANAGMRHDGKPYPQDRIDDTTITWKWAMSFPRVRDKALELINEKIHNDAALTKLMKIFAVYKNKSEYSGLDEYNGNIHEFNQKFSFQRLPVDRDYLEKFQLYVEIQKTLSPDDILGALGAFQINAAVGKFFCVNHYKDGRTQGRVVTIESVVLYIKDSYDFLDENEEASQYLGHWNRKGLYMAPMPGKMGGIFNAPSPIKWMERALLMDGKSVYDKDSVMYPASNKDFREWRKKYNQGGDFLIYSKPIEFFLKNPIRFIAP
jgi:Family of unknown function (DUF6402)